MRGPGRHAGEFPVVRGERCSLLAEADVVLFDLDNDPRTRAVVLAVMRATRPELLVVVQSAAPPPGVPHDAPTTSVNGQVAALRAAVLRSASPVGTSKR